MFLTCGETPQRQHQTKNSLIKYGTNCTQTTKKRQGQPSVKVSEFYFHIYGYILLFLEPKWISHTKSIKIKNNTIGRSWAWVACVESHNDMYMGLPGAACWTLCLWSSFLGWLVWVAHLVGFVFCFFLTLFFYFCSLHFYQSCRILLCFTMLSVGF